MLVFLLCACALSVTVGQDMPKYDQRYDYLDVDAILDSKRLVRNYVDCLINAKPCTPEGKALKRILPEALRTKCVRCTEKQKRTAVKVIKRLKYEYPEEWAKLQSRWDPTGDFTRFFEEFFDKQYFNTIPNYGNEIPGSSSSAPPPPPRVPGPTPSVPAPPPPPAPTQPPQPAAPPPVDATTSPRPLILNRFGNDGELVVEQTSDSVVPRQTTTSPTKSTPFATTKPVVPTRPTQMTWATAGSGSSVTRFPLRPVTDMPPVYTTTITLIDQIGYKIMRTTELVTDILKNTVRAVVGR